MHDSLLGGHDSDSAHKDLEKYGFDLPLSHPSTHTHTHTHLSHMEGGMDCFEVCVDHPEVPLHRYWEAIFHAKETGTHTHTQTETPTDTTTNMHLQRNASMASTASIASTTSGHDDTHTHTHTPGVPNVHHPRHHRAVTLPPAPLLLRVCVCILRRKVMEKWYVPVLRPALVTLLETIGRCLCVCVCVCL